MGLCIESTLEKQRLGRNLVLPEALEGGVTVLHGRLETQVGMTSANSVAFSIIAGQMIDSFLHFLATGKVPVTA